MQERLPKWITDGSGVAPAKKRRRRTDETVHVVTEGEDESAGAYRERLAQSPSDAARENAGREGTSEM
jgi:hypothetical protein